MGELGGKAMNKAQPEYLSYLLRLWRENDGRRVHGVETAVWRASLERPQEGERHGFATLEDLFAYLRKETGSGSSSAECLEKKGGDGCSHRRSRGEERGAREREEPKSKNQEV
jgi:hypothetical protein